MRDNNNLIDLPDFALVVLIGATGAGKSTFASKWFLPTEIVSSDHCRALVCDDQTSLTVNESAFSVAAEIVAQRLKNRKLTVIDATNVRKGDRKAWIDLAKRWHAVPVAIVIDPGTKTCIERNASRADRSIGKGAQQRMTEEIRKGASGLQKEGFRKVWRLSSTNDIETTCIERVPLWTDKRWDDSHFDIIGDIHGCADELIDLLRTLGYLVDLSDGNVTISAPQRHKLVFLGDLVDRGPRTPDVLRIVMAAVEAGIAYAVQGNHDRKLAHWLMGKKVKVGRALQISIDQINAESEEFRTKVRGFLDGLRSHYWLDGGRLAVAHAGIKEEMIGRGSKEVREFALYGETEQGDDGNHVRRDWASKYRGKTVVVYGHTRLDKPQWVNNTLCVDTGCVYGGSLTALLWPERELVSVPAKRAHYISSKSDKRAVDQTPPRALTGAVLDYADVSGRRWIDTEFQHRVVVPEENAIAALEVMSRFAIAPQWLVYLPPTMSPVATSQENGWLERPEQALDYYADHNVPYVFFEEKHMGSRANVAICRDDHVARRRFSATSGETGAIWTRTGRPFFDNHETTEQVLARIRRAVDACNLWDDLKTDWLLLDCEIMPWSAKASNLINRQYRPVSTASQAGLSEALNATARAADRGVNMNGWQNRFFTRLDKAIRFTDAWTPFVWPVSSVDNLRIAPFHILASEGSVHFDKDHGWHTKYAFDLASSDDSTFITTQIIGVETNSFAQCKKAIAWWESITAGGGEGAVVKPANFSPIGEKGLIQPAIKVRGQEYLRIVYGPEYDLPENLSRLKARNLTGKRRLALQEFALGHEALKRFVAGETLRRVHECVFGILALESEPIDPRL